MMRSPNAAPFRSEAFAEDLIEPADDRRLDWLAWTIVAASLVAMLIV